MKLPTFIPLYLENKNYKLSEVNSVFEVQPLWETVQHFLKKLKIDYVIIQQFHS